MLNQISIQLLQKFKLKNVHPVNSARIWSHDRQIESLLL